LEVVERHKDRFRIVTLSAGQNVARLAKQARHFKPKLICIRDERDVPPLKSAVANPRIRVTCGQTGLVEASTHPDVDLVIFSVVGAHGLAPLVAAIQAGKDVAFANKEPFVIAGDLIRRLARRHKVRLLPIDSELSAIFQCLAGNRLSETKRIILTSSGGPFRGFDGKDLGEVTIAQALQHPKWKMGKKITIDSATLMNKGLEVIETSKFFGIPHSKIQVLIHPQAIIHSLVEFIDGAHLAQLATTDMKIPIQYAMGYPERLSSNGSANLDFLQIQSLSFEKPDVKRFPCLELGYEALRIGGTMPAVLNAANESAVDLFLRGKLNFTNIPISIEKVMQKHRCSLDPDLDAIWAADQWARRQSLGRV
jgi:1-deoxy-D-xylulose-5-phosphate reductoisomerase